MTHRLSNLSHEDILQYVNLKDNLIELLNRICATTGVCVDELRSINRCRCLVDVRTSYSRIAKDTYPKASESLIGSLINRDHSYVHYMLNQAVEVREKRLHCEELREKLKIVAYDFQI